MTIPLVQDANELASWIGAIASAITALATVVISFFVGRYTRQRDKSEIDLLRWQLQQEQNIACVTNDDLLESFERITYGDDHNYDKYTSTKLFHIFLRLNLVMHYYVAFKNRIISKREFENNAIPTLRLFARQTEIITYALEQRGYPADFGKEVLRLLSSVEPPMQFTAWRNGRRKPEAPTATPPSDRPRTA